MPGGRRPRWVARAAAVLAMGLGVAACGHGPPSPVPATSPAASPSATEATVKVASSGRATAPLTGLPVRSAADAARPAVALVVSGVTPRGLTAADVVFEEMTTPVRYIAVFQSRQASAVGPITSTQPTDREALAVLHPLVGYQGAAAPFFIKLLDKSKVHDAGFAHFPGAYKATSAGLTASTSALARAVHGDAAPPPLFSYRGLGAGAAAGTSASALRSVGVSIPGHGTQDWAFDSRADRWVLTSGGPRVEVANLVIQTVSYKQVGVGRRTGLTVSSAQVIGAGRAEVLSSGAGRGYAAMGTWSKPRSGDVTNYFGPGGSLVEFQPGPTWVILAPRGTQVSSSR